MKAISLSLIFLSFTLFLNSQELVTRVVASGGGHSESTSFKLSFTVGDLIVDKIETQNNYFTTGFQQYWNLSVGIDDITGELIINAYPNPFSDILKIGFGEINYNSLRIDILSMSGTLLVSKEIEGPFIGRTEEINLSDVKPGLFILRISSPDKRITRTIQLVKQ